MKQNDKENELNDDTGVSIYTLSSKIYSHIKYLASKWIILLLLVIIGVTIGVWYAATRKPKYRAAMTFTIEETSQASSALSGLASQLGLNVGGDKQSIFEGYNIIAFFQSRLMVQKTLLSEAPFEHGNELLVNRYIDFNHYRSGWKKNKKLKNLTFEANSTKPLTRLQDSVLGAFSTDIVRNQLNVDRVDRRLTILTLSYVCGDELFSKEFSETLAKNVTQFYINNRVQKTVHTIDVLQHQTDSLRNKLNRSMNGVASSVDAVPNANPLKSVLAVRSQNKTIDVEIDRTALIQLASNLQQSKISLNQETPLIDFIDVPILPLDVQKVSTSKGGAIGGILALALGIALLTFTRKTY